VVVVVVVASCLAVASSFVDLAVVVAASYPVGLVEVVGDSSFTLKLKLRLFPIAFQAQHGSQNTDFKGNLKGGSIKSPIKLKNTD
jgi:hypothetical protein